MLHVAGRQVAVWSTYLEVGRFDRGVRALFRAERLSHTKAAKSQSLSAGRSECTNILMDVIAPSLGGQPLQYKGFLSDPQLFLEVAAAPTNNTASAATTAHPNLRCPPVTLSNQGAARRPANHLCSGL